MNSQGLLKGLKVIELANVLAGPSVGAFLSELGATVIKVENILTRGDVTRTWKLPTEAAENDISSYFSCVNWGKYSLAVNLKSRQGLKIVHALVSQGDVVLASYKPGDAEKLKVDYHTLKELNSRLIYAQVSGYGLKNPRAGYDAIIQAESGFTYMNGEQDSIPTRMPVALMDVLASHQLREAILLSLIYREKTGKGQHIEVSLLQSGIASLANQAANWLVGGIIPQRMGSDHPNIVPYGTIFNTKDGSEIVLAVGTDKQFRDLCHILGKPQLGGDAKFSTNRNRVKHRNELLKILQQLIQTVERDKLLKLLKQRKVPVGGVYNMKEVFEQPEAKALLLEGTTSGSVKLKGVRTNAFQFIDNILQKQIHPPPHYGEHTVMILKDMLSNDDNEIAKLFTEGVVYADKHDRK